MSNTVNSIQTKRPLLMPETIFIAVWSIIVIAFCVTIIALIGPKNSIQDVQIEDSTGQIDETLLKNDLKELSTYKDMNVFVYVKNGKSSDNINEDTLNYARTDHPELLDEPKWADGWFIMTLNIESGNKSPGSGQIGTYYGEDVKINNSAQKASQDAGKSSFKERNWTEGLTQVADKSSKTMARPFYASPGLVIFLTLVVLFVSFVIYALTRYSRYLRDTAIEKLQAQTEKVDTTARHAGDVFVGKYVKRIKDSSHNLLEIYTDLLDDKDELLKLNVLTFGLAIFQTGTFHKSVNELVNETEIISDAITLYEHNDGWQEVWKNHTEETRESIQTLLTDSDFWVYQKQASDFNEQMGKLDEDMYSGEVDVDLIFQKIDTMNEQISSIIKDHLEGTLSVIDKPKKRDLIQKNVDLDTVDFKHRRRTIFNSYSHYPYYTPAVFYSGYTTGVNSYNSSTSTSGYGGSGGGFSGSGSSSSF